MGCIIIAMLKSEDAKKIANLLKTHGIIHDINICETGAQVLRIANNRDYGAVICTKNMTDMSYMELADMLPEYYGIVCLSKDPSLKIIGDNMVKLLLPLKTQDLVDTVDMINHNLCVRIKKKKKPQRDEADKKLVNMAKLMLMDRNGLTEEEAYRYIQKNSMDFGRRMVESAQMILTLYG